MFKYFLTILLLLVLSPTVFTGIQTNIGSSKTLMEFTNLAVYMTKRFVSPKTSTLVITEKCSLVCRVDRDYQRSLLTNILSRLHGEFAIQLFLGHQNDRLWDYNIFIVDSPEAFVSLCHTFPKTEHERFFNFFVLLTWSANSALEQYETLFRILQTSADFKVKNVVVMNKSFNGNHIGFYTYEFFNKENCQDRITIREINRYENGTLQNEVLFPGLINNVHGCYFNVSALLNEPLLKFDGDVNNKTHLAEINRLSGVEGDILKAVAKALNFKIRLNFCNEENALSLFRNSTGCFSDLYNKRANLVVGGFSSNLPNSDKLSSSYVYHTTPLVFIVRSGLCFGPIKQLFNPLRPSIWILILCFFLISTIFTKMIQTKPKVSELIFGPKNKKPISSMLIIFIGNALPTKILPKNNFARFLLAGLLLLSFEVRNGYQGKMFDSLRLSKRIPVPRRISQLLKQDYTLMAPCYRDFYPKEKTKIVHNITKRLNMVQTSSMRLTTTLFLDSLAHYNFVNHKTSNLTYVEQAIHTIPFVMYFQQNSLIGPSIDSKIQMLSAAGITSCIAKRNVPSWFQNMNANSKFEIKLTNDNLEGLYLISGVMLLISVLVFVLELLARKSNRLQKIMDALNSF